MSDPENCALNSDSTLKDVSQIKFFNLPSDKYLIGKSGPASDDEAKSGTVSNDKLPTVMELGWGLKGKAPATCVGGKCIIKPSLKVCNSDQKSVQAFFMKIFTGEQTVLMFSTFLSYTYSQEGVRGFNIFQKGSIKER